MEANGSKWKQMEPNGAKWMQMEPNGTKWSQKDANRNKLKQMEPNGAKWGQMEPFLLPLLLWHLVWTAKKSQEYAGGGIGSSGILNAFVIVTFGMTKKQKQCHCECNCYSDICCEQPKATRNNQEEAEAVALLVPLLLWHLVSAAKRSQVKPRESRSSGIVVAIVTVIFGVNNQGEPSGARRKQQQWHCCCHCYCDMWCDQPNEARRMQKQWHCWCHCYCDMWCEQPRAAKWSQEEAEAVALLVPLLLWHVVWTAKSSQVKPGGSRSSGIVGAIIIVTCGVNSQEKPERCRSSGIVSAIVTVTCGVSNQEEPSGARRKQ